LGYKEKDWIETLALEAETAISQLPSTEQEYVRYQVAHNISYTKNTIITSSQIRHKRKEKTHYK